jgi:hypothetical protein
MGEKERQQRRKELLEYYFKPLTKVNVPFMNVHNDYAHEERKLHIFYILRKQGFNVISEGEFIKEGICDLFCLDTETIYEVLNSETPEELKEKVKKYPNFKIVQSDCKRPFVEVDYL